jgi:hypothetical protein
MPCISSRRSFTWGVSTDVPLPGDYDGDGKADPAAYRPSTGQWFILTSGSSYTASIVVSWGVSTDVPVPADYDGDGKADIAVYRPSTGTWYIVPSSTNFPTAYLWGVSTDVPVPGDYDGDGKADPAVYRPSTGQWFVLASGSGYTASIVVAWGISTDVPCSSARNRAYYSCGSAEYAYNAPGRSRAAALRLAFVSRTEFLAGTPSVRYNFRRR